MIMRGTEIGPDLEQDTRSGVAVDDQPGGVFFHDSFRNRGPAVAMTSGAQMSGQGSVLRRLRLLTGLVMFAYIAVHLANHALGIISLSLAESGLRLEMAFWRTTVATLLLYGAAALHFSLALWTLYSRREWRLPAVEILH